MDHKIMDKLSDADKLSNRLLDEIQEVLEKDSRPPIPYWAALWICLTNWKQWRLRRKIDRAIVAMAKNSLEPELVNKMMELSDKLWREAFERK